ncbi:unnamed protein product [Camellia sinensis]
MGMRDLMHGGALTVIVGVRCKIDNAVRVGVVERVNHYLPDEEGKAKIGRFAKNAAVYACHEGLKCLPLPG